MQTVAVSPTLQITRVEPTFFEKRHDLYFVDFGKSAWGNLELILDEVPSSPLVIRLGEKLDSEGKIDREPPGSVNFREIFVTPQEGQTVYQLEIAPLAFHDNEEAVEMPPGFGEVTPFRYAEIESTTLPLAPNQLCQLFVHAAFDDDASSFRCSDSTLNAVWDLCKYTMKATTAFGIYIDGERERIPYEADAYINQLSHLACDFDPTVARASIQYLLANPTWPTEWGFHSIMMVAADYRATGDRAFAAQHYPALKDKLLMEKAREDGLLRAGGIIDWPPGERDNYNDGMGFEDDALFHSGPETNTVVNAFFFHALECMATLADALGEEEEAAWFQGKSEQVHSSFNRQFFDTKRGVYVDGVNSAGERSSHASLHANMFPLAFGLVSPANQGSVADYIESRGMACSVYGAQYLLEALFRADRDEAALRLLTARGERSWWHMIELGSTMTLEAWDEKYKPNLTWNHAWGAAPANLASRFILGVRPLQPGYEETLIAPQLGTLQWAKGKVPTPYGPLKISCRKESTFNLQLKIPHGVTASIKWPSPDDSCVFINGICQPLQNNGMVMVKGSGQFILTST